MIWGIGTGRCGTKSLAKMLGGLHEPEPRLEPALHHRDRRRQVLLDRELLAHRKHKIKAVVDRAQTRVLNEIEDIDPDAKFVLIARHVLPCVGSFLSGGAANLFDPDELPRPKEIARRSVVVQLVWLWKQYNRLALEHFRRTSREWIVMTTEDLTKHENVFPTRWHWDDASAGQVKKECEPIWQEILERRQGG